MGSETKGKETSLIKVLNEKNILLSLQNSKFRSGDNMLLNSNLSGTGSGKQ